MRNCGIARAALAALIVIGSVEAHAASPVLTVLYKFKGSPDGDIPNGDLVFDAAGNLYGTTRVGGLKGFGTVFELHHPTQVVGVWTESVLHSFGKGADGAFPYSGLFSAPGALYGETELVNQIELLKNELHMIRFVIHLGKAGSRE